MTAAQSTARHDTHPDAAISGSGRIVLIALCSAAFLGTMNAVAFGPFIPTIARELHSTVPVVGQIVTVMLILSALLGLVVGPLADLYGARRLLLIGIGAIVVSALGTAAAGTYLLLLSARLVGAVSSAILAGLALATAGTYFTGDARRRAMSLVVASLSGAGIVGVPLLAFIGGVAGWRVAFLVFALVSLPGMLLVALALPRDPAPTAALPGVAALLAAYRPLWHHRPTVAVLASTCLRGIAWSGAVTYLSGFFAQQYGYLPAQFAVVMLIAGVAYLLGSVITGRLTGVPPRTGIGVATIALAVLLGLTYLLPVGAVATMSFITGACVVASFGWVHLTTLLASETPAGRGTTMIFQGVLFNLGGAAGGAVGGMLLASGGYGALGIAFPCFAVASALCVWRPRVWIVVREKMGERAIATRPVARRAQP